MCDIAGYLGNYVYVPTLHEKLVLLQYVCNFAILSCRTSWYFDNMALQYIKSAQGYFNLWCSFVFAVRALFEIILSILKFPFKHHLAPDVICIDTAFNQHVVSKCKSLEMFNPLWWANGPHAQTFVMACIPSPRNQDQTYRRELLTLDSDGVQVRFS